MTDEERGLFKSEMDRLWKTLEKMDQHSEDHRKQLMEKLNQIESKLSKHEVEIQLLKKAQESLSALPSRVESNTLKEAVRDAVEETRAGITGLILRIVLVVIALASTVSSLVWFLLTQGAL